MGRWVESVSAKMGSNETDEIFSESEKLVQK